jgi:hypothetical protein
MKKYHNKEVYQKHGRKIEVKDGFSWSVLIFGMFALIYRGMYKEAIICVMTFQVAILYYIFNANFLYSCKLENDGWERL